MPSYSKGPMDLIYDTIFAALKNNAAFAVDELNVPNENIRPNHDISEPKPGGALTYSWSTSRWLAREGKGNGILTVLAEHPDSAIKSEQILQKFREICTTDVLTNETKINVAVFEETDEAQDPLPATFADKPASQTSFKVLLTLGAEYANT